MGNYNYTLDLSENTSIFINILRIFAIHTITICHGLVIIG